MVRTIKEWVALIEYFEDERSPDLILDVRSQNEYGQGHICGAINVPHIDVAKQYKIIATHAGGRRGRILIYCRTQKRAEYVKEFLDGIGFTGLDMMSEQWSPNIWEAAGGSITRG